MDENAPAALPQPDNGADSSAERRQTAGLEVWHAGKNLGLRMSFGVSSHPTHGQEAEMLIIKADQALYYSKNTGRNRVTAWDETLPGLAIT